MLHSGPCGVKKRRMATGIFNTARTGHNLRSRKRRSRTQPLDRFAELLSRHDLESGDPGGSITLVASQIGIPTSTGYQMFRRIRERLGPQAR